MYKEYLMGNEAIALGALAAGVNVVAGYPGTPSTEVLETIAKRKTEHVYVEWSVNEKAALELVAGAAYSGARTMVTMKQVGLNVASDSLMSLAYIGVKGGTVIMVADDPGPISSQTEQDTRHFAAFSKLPCFDPTSVQEAYEMIQDAFEYSEKYNTPVIFRPTTRVCHAYATVDIKEEKEYQVHKPEGFIKDSSKWVIFPRLSYANHMKIEKRNADLMAVFSDYAKNRIIEVTEVGSLAEKPKENLKRSSIEDLKINLIEGIKENLIRDFEKSLNESYRANEKEIRRGIATQGISYSYTMEAMKKVGTVKTLKVATPFPFPEQLAVAFLKDLDEVLCIEELDPVIERELTYLCGKYHLPTKILGKLTGHVKNAGENTRDSVLENIQAFLVKDIRLAENTKAIQDTEDTKNIEVVNNEMGETKKDSKGLSSALPPALPVRPPVLCAGCPHRASFFAVKEAMKGQEAVFCGDIGCYTLGNAMPLDMVDTCLCMGAGINIAQGLGKIEPNKKYFAFVGDSTFFASALTGIVNAVYNQANMTVVILDNSTTAMTGHQPHPGTGHTMMGEIVEKINIATILKGIGVSVIEERNPLDLKEAIKCVKETANKEGVKAIIFKSPCVALVKANKSTCIDTSKCINCKKCIKTLGCPAIVIKEDKVCIDSSLCTGCGLCMQVCPVNAIKGGCNCE